MRGSAAASRWRMSQVPSVEQSSTITSSRSMFSGSGAASTRARLCSTTVRSLYTGIKIDRSMRIPQYNWVWVSNRTSSSNTELPQLPAFACAARFATSTKTADRLLIVATDRISAFDFILATGIPDKGRVLTQMTLFWLDFLRDVVPNHFLSADTAGLPPEFKGRSMWVRRAEMFQVECVARGYLAGSGWKDYQRTGAICGIPLPPGLRESDALPEPIFTPATKAQSGHDENISFEQAAAIVGAPTAAKLRDLTLTALHAKPPITRAPAASSSPTPSSNSAWWTARSFSPMKC